VIRWLAGALQNPLQPKMELGLQTASVPHASVALAVHAGLAAAAPSEPFELPAVHLRGCQDGRGGRACTSCAVALYAQ
jgi:hypothetical protein